MASIQPTYQQDLLSYRFANKIEGNGVSNFDYFYSVTNKNFLFKNKGEKVTTLVNIDFIKVDNLILNNNILTTL